jgi:hypothetical protein
MRRRGKERKERKRERQKQIKNLSEAANNHQMGFLQILELFLQSVPQKLCKQKIQTSYEQWILPQLNKVKIAFQLA